MKKFKLGLDLHGVIDAIPEELSFLSEAVVRAGGEVHVLTGSSLTHEVHLMIEKLGIKFTHVFSVYDFMVLEGAENTGIIEFPDGSRQLKFKNEEWDRVKGDYCAKHKISLHIDDTLAYNQNFVTPFARLWTHNGKTKASHVPIHHVE